MSTIKDKIRAARLPERIIELCLNGQLVAEFEATERELEVEIRKPKSDSLDGGGETRALAERLEELRQQMLDGAVTFRLRGLTRRRWRKLLAEHPPRQDDDGTVDQRDLYLGVNSDTFFPALVIASTVEPELDDEDWLALLGDDEQDGALTSKQFDQLAKAAQDLSREPVDVPFSLAASRILNSAPE